MTADRQDVDWHHTFDYMFASVGDDKLLNMYVEIWLRTCKVY